MQRKHYLLVMLACMTLPLHSQRLQQQLDKDWDFRFSHQVERGSSIRIAIPHTWNTQDALSGKIDYKRGIGNYERKLYIDPQWQGKRLFLRFEGVNSVADVFLNGKCLGEHRGGYSAFVFEITDRVNYGQTNTLLVRVSNAERLDVMPLVGDFNMYGGIYRDVHLIVTDPTCISLTDYASPGVYLTTKQIGKDRAEVAATVRISNQTDAREIILRAEVKDQNHIVCSEERQIELKAYEELSTNLLLNIRNPHLWNGRKDPFLYQTEFTLWASGQLLDKVVQPLGLRTYRVDPEKGFILNGESLKLRGVCRHQDRAEIGNALLDEHHEEDVQIMLEMGANAVRLAHYQQAETMYDLTDKHGLITWAEIPFVGPGGYLDKGFVDLPEFRENGKEQLKELIRQNYNHPSICFWGLFNELKESGDNPTAYVEELNQLAHSEDSVRPTTAASNQNGQLNFITDCIAWNRYDGWYGGDPNQLAKFLDRTHRDHPELCIGISEYGAGASIYHQQDTLKQTVPVSYWHPENWQTYYHMANWKILNERPFVWGSFIWNLFDFGAAHRHEGDRNGINDKGLVTFDRKNKKDAFYFYKANWNPEPMLHLTGKRNHRSTTGKRDIMAFTNRKEIELLVNGQSIGKAIPDTYSTVIWKNVALQPGKNEIQVRTTDRGKTLTDHAEIYVEKTKLTTEKLQKK